jgi:hypothetical protein
MIYEVVKTDPNYIKYQYKGSANIIQAMMKEQINYKIFRNNSDNG